MVWDPSSTTGGFVSNATFVVGTLVDAPVNALLATAGTGIIITLGPGTITFSVDSTVYATKAYVDTQDNAIKTALTGIGYLKGAGAFPPSFVTKIPLSDIDNSGGAIGDLTQWNGTNWVKLPDVAVGSLLASGGVGVAVSWNSGPTITDITLTSLTANRYVVSDGAKKLVSQDGVPLADLKNSGGAVGDIIYWNGTNWVRLAAVATGSILGSQGVTTAPAWLSTVTLTTLTVTTLNVTNINYTGTIKGGDQTKGGTESSVVQVTSNSDGTAKVCLSITPQVSSATRYLVSIVLQRTSGTPAVTDVFMCDAIGDIQTSSGGVVTTITAPAIINSSTAVSGVTVSAAITSNKYEISVTVPNTQTWNVTLDWGRTSAI